MSILLKAQRAMLRLEFRHKIVSICKENTFSRGYCVSQVLNSKEK